MSSIQSVVVIGFELRVHAVESRRRNSTHKYPENSYRGKLTTMNFFVKIKCEQSSLSIHRDAPRLVLIPLHHLEAALELQRLHAELFLVQGEPEV